jgi:hypothetical protein
VVTMRIFAVDIYVEKLKEYALKGGNFVQVCTRCDESFSC